MKTFLTIFFSIQLALISQTEFSIEKYRQYLESHKNMTYSELLNEYPAHEFDAGAPTNFFESNYADSINNFLWLSQDEISLLNSHSFMVTERVSYPSFLDASYELFKKDIPVYLSADMILHAVHKSVDNILIDIEKHVLYDKLKSSLFFMVNELKKYDRNKYISDPIMHKKYTDLIDDAYLYLSVSINTLQGEEVAVPYESISEKYYEITEEIEKQKGFSVIQLFADSSMRRYDWSQFKPRGHYDDNGQELRNYFKTLIWLGRTEIFINTPKDQEPDPMFKVKESDIMRQNRLAYFITYLAQKSGASPILKEIDEVIATFIGRQDNITNFELEEVIGGKVTIADDLLNDNLIAELKSSALELSSANQTYLSQILMSNPMIIDEIEPAAAFLLMGQRPILDGFITSKVTYDRITYNDAKIQRMLPSSLDVLFGLGNNASIQALEKELQAYPYSSNLAALRYLINSYDEEFWSKNVYTSWLNSIRGLNPKNTRDERDELPKFMRTAAWWQKSMNTQLASWAELRHDFLLYAKQPYTAGVPGCSTPDAFLEPQPDMFASIKNIFINLKKLKLNHIELNSLNHFLDATINTFDKLETIASKTLNRTLSNDDQEFLNEFLCTKEVDMVCVKETRLDGWYSNLYYNYEVDVRSLNRDHSPSMYTDFLVADIHTSPTDEDGEFVGWVKHIATGPINMAVIVTKNKDGEQTAYAGPVSSFYEFTTQNFERKTDNEWQEEFYGTSNQLNLEELKYNQTYFTKHYMANYEGQKYNAAPELLVTSVEDIDYTYNNQNVSVYPNPATSVINLSCEVTAGDLTADFKLMNLEGTVVQSERIDFVATGSNIKRIELNKTLGSGTYVYSLEFGKSKYSGKVNIVR